ncbi:thymidine kinase [Mycoplasma sp. 3341]|uniref:thymidine kinase n=1 Tax=Mycoplasma sp. 3341 TaxID=3447506 RepID=UPI003F6567B5
MQYFDQGIIQVITGPMFSGKSEELLKRVRTLEYAGYKMTIIKPAIDTRFGKDNIVSRSGIKHETHSLQDIKDIYQLIEEDTNAIIIDEAQFFGDEIVEIVDDLANKGYLVIVSGLDQDYRRKPFKNMAMIMAIAEKVTKLYAVCVVCKNRASCSYRTVNSKKTILIDDESSYEARCRNCHILKK